MDRSLTSTIGQREDKGVISSTGTHLLKSVGIPHTRRISLQMAASLHEDVLRSSYFPLIHVLLDTCQLFQKCPSHVAAFAWRLYKRAS